MLQTQFVETSAFILKKEDILDSLVRHTECARTKYSIHESCFLYVSRTINIMWIRHVHINIPHVIREFGKLFDNVHCLLEVVKKNIRIIIKIQSWIS